MSTKDITKDFDIKEQEQETKELGEKGLLLIHFSTSTSYGFC